MCKIGVFFYLYLAEIQVLMINIIWFDLGIGFINGKLLSIVLYSGKCIYRNRHSILLLRSVGYCCLEGVIVSLLFELHIMTCTVTLV